MTTDGRVTVVTTYNQSRDHGEQRLGILSLHSQIQISTLDIVRDADIEIPTSRPLAIALP